MKASDRAGSLAPSPGQVAERRLDLANITTVQDAIRPVSADSAG